MHLGAVSTVIVSLPLKDAARRMRQFGLKSIEIGTGGFLPKNDCDPAKLLGDESALAEFKGTLAEPDLKISACAMHGEPLRPDPAISQAYRRDFPDTCALAQKRGRRETMPGHAPGATPRCQLPRAHSISLRGVLLGPGPITWVGWEPRWVLP
jgi:sugar phosphate isomerase/epimerase